MHKVYFNEKYPKCWCLKELTDIYHFKTTHFDTNQSEYLFLTWTRNIDVSEYDQSVVRVYDVEIEGEKYYFLVTQVDDGFLLESKDKYHLEKLLNLKNISFVGDSLDTL
jgi:hypothetical protein